MTVEDLIAVANNKKMNTYDVDQYSSKVETFNINEFTDDVRALNVSHGFRPRPYQIESINFMLQKDKKGQFKRGLRASLNDHRRAGKTLRNMEVVKLRALQQPGIYFLVYPSLNQGRKVVWDGIGYNEEGKAFKILEVIPKSLWKKKDNHLMSLELFNGSIIQIVGSVGIDGTADHLRGTNPIFACFDEFAAMSPDAWRKVISPVFMENGGSAMFTFTPDGKNHAYDLHTDYMKKFTNDPDGRFFAETLTIDDTTRNDGSPVVDEEFLNELRDQGVPEEDIQREFYCSFDVASDATFYGHCLERCYSENRIRMVKEDQNKPIVASYDIGIGEDDFTTVWVTQIIDKNTINHLYYNEWVNVPLPQVLKEVERLYDIRLHVLPWDARKRDDLTGLTKVQRLEEANVTRGEIERVERVSVEHGINLVREGFVRYYFDTAGCLKGLERLKHYKKKVDRSTGAFINGHIHDENSHGADGIRTFANAQEQGLFDQICGIIEWEDDEEAEFADFTSLKDF